MRKLFQHIVLYVAINGLLVAVWLLLTGGSVDLLRQVLDSPSEAVGLGFWPVWPILGWGTLLVIHIGMALSNFLFGDKERRRRRRMAREAKFAARDLAKGAGEAGSHLAHAGTQIAKEVAAAIDRAHQRRTERKVAGTTVETSGRRWVTVMFCDIVESTAHNERLGDEEWARILSQVRGVVRSALADRGGSEVGTQGDGTLARFPSPAEAVLCAVDVQAELSDARGSSEFVPDLRIGIHAGEAVEEDGDLVGRVINLASRVTGEADPGEILVTEPVADQLVGKLELEDRGLRVLKGLSQPRHLLAVKWGED